MKKFVVKKLPEYVVKIKAEMTIKYSDIEEILHLQFLADQLHIGIPTLLGDAEKHEKAIAEIGGYDDVKVTALQVIAKG